MKNTIQKMQSLTSLLLVCIATSSFAQQFTPPDNSKTMRASGYAPVNGLKMYYEIHGEGKPLVLLHGAFMTISLNWGDMIPHLAKNHQVIALEMQGHGRTADRNAEYTYPVLANDVAALLQHLKIDSADVIGYSLGGTVAYSLAIQHPKLVKNLVIISSVFKHDGWIKPVRDVIATLKPEFFENTPLKSEYDRLAPDKTQWTAWVNRMVRFDNKSYNLGAENIKKISAPVLIISGDSDGVDLNHIVEMYTLAGGGVFGDMAGLPKSQLAILPGMTHVSVMMQTDKLVSIIAPFLDKTISQMPTH
jgi:pimeloyl-ACP methyl ester carboxylesterase